MGPTAIRTEARGAPSAPPIHVEGEQSVMTNTTNVNAAEVPANLSEPVHDGLGHYFTAPNRVFGSLGFGTGMSCLSHGRLITWIALAVLAVIWHCHINQYYGRLDALRSGGG